jgi:GNAT superfamily N-acetyltransferase
MSSLGWAGAVAVFVVLDIAALTDPDAQLGRVLWLALQAAVWSLLIPLAFASLITGIVLALGTAWGLFRHYWVLFKLALTLIATIVLVMYNQTIETVAGMAVDPAMAGMGFPTALVHTGGGLVVLLLTTILAIYKPRGMTKYGQRKQLEQRQ